ncbi:RAD9, HUS1, RAD1-interacting nuclear orphan protein 1 [Cololabis saira]|uniref:RAD9, HUS1, RAD1-interacting nuclear orphan protein 1 n=1 Tax=Cololabis saira TaxID=129043 RepID=UPI002AD2BBCD|nr:RAD9, HUS1, RAD1-interacting nuclear orphan protein 1 [Cololabis saira]
MPRKVSKTDKPALQFRERPVGGARLQHVPEVRAALNPRQFFTDEDAETHNNPALNSWVNPQFDFSAVAAPPVRRGRRKCQSITRILDSSSQLSRKNSVCKFPSLSFHTGSRDQPRNSKKTRAKEVADHAVVSEVKNHPQRSCQKTIAASSSHCSETPKRQLDTVRKRNTGTFPDRASSHPSCLDRAGIQSTEATERCRIPADGVLTPVNKEFSTSEVSSAGPPPDVDTPKITQEGSNYSLSPFGLGRQCTPPCHQQPDILVADTPERDYGVKVTWRRRKGFMLMMKERGHLSESDVIIPN